MTSKNPIYIFDNLDNLLAITENYSEAIFEEAIENKGSTLQIIFPANEEHAEHLIGGNQVAFHDLENNLRLFIIREIDDEDGSAFEKTVTCLPAMDELDDAVVENQIPQDKDAGVVITNLLVGTRWQKGNIAELGLNSTSFYYMYVKQSLLQVSGVWGGELIDRITVDDTGISGRFIDLAFRRGADKGKIFEIDKDIESITRTVLYYPKTALYGRGASIESGEGFSRRITFEDVVWTVANGNPVDKPAGQKWVGDPDALLIHGIDNNGVKIHRFGQFEEQDEEDPEKLLSLTYQQLQISKNPMVRYKMSVNTFYGIAGYEHEQVLLGDTGMIINKKIKPEILLESRVISLKYDIGDPMNGEVIVGNFLEIGDDQSKIDWAVDKVAEGSGGWDAPPEIGDGSFPDDVPPVPSSVEVNGLFRVIQLSWDYDPSSYIGAYEVYASQIQGFTPDVSNLVYRGKTGGYVHNADTNQIWYFRLRTINTHGTPSLFTIEFTGETSRIDLGEVAPGVITGVEIQDFAISTGKILDNAINGAKIAAGAVTQIKVFDGAISNTKLADLAVTASKLADGSVNNNKIMDDAISALKIAAGAVTEAKIATDAITAVKIAANAITGVKIIDNAITVGKILDGAVANAKIAAGAVTELKIGLGAVTNTKLGALAVDAAKLADGSITNTKILNGAVNNAKLDDLSVTAGKIVDGSITTPKIANLAVDNSKIAALSVDAGKLVDGSITNTKILDNAITSLKIAAGEVKEAQIATNAITTLKILDGAIANAKIASGAITDIKIGSGAVTNIKLANLAVDAAKLADSAVTATKIASLAVGTAAIQDAAITNAKINDLNATKITAGLINTARIQIGDGVTFAPGFDPTKKVNSEGFITGNSDGTANRWTKIGSASLTALYANFDVDINIAGGTSNVVESRWAQIHWRIKQVNAMGSAPAVSVHYMAGQGILPSHFKAVIVANTTFVTTVDLYVLIDILYEQYSYTPININSYNAMYSWASYNPMIVSLPAGTQIAGEDKSYLIWAYPNTTLIDGGDIYTNTVTANAIAALTITAAQIAATTITGAKIVSNTITATQIAASTITATQMVAGTITAASGIIGDAAITTAKIANLAVGNAAIANLAVTNGKIGLLAVDTAQIANAAIQAAQIESLAVGTAAIANGAITNAKIGNLAVGTAQIADAAINSAKIANLAVGNAAIANGAIDNAKILNLDAGKITTGLLNAARVQIGTGTQFDTGYDPTLIDVGGRNLLLGTKEMAGISYKTSELYNGFAVATGSPATGYNDVFTKQTPVLEGTEYTVSFYAKSTNVAQNIVCHFYNPNTTTNAVSSTGQTSTGVDGGCSVSVTNVWKRYWVTWKQSAGGSTKSLIVGRVTAPGNVSIAGVMFEKRE